MITENELDADRNGEVIDVDQDSKDSARVKTLVPCRNDCRGCPHGPYDYRVRRDGESLNWEYIGPSTP